MKEKEFNSVLIIGLGLIGSSLLRAVKEYGLAENIFGLDSNQKNIENVKNWGFYLKVLII